MYDDMYFIYIYIIYFLGTLLFLGFIWIIWIIIRPKPMLCKYCETPLSYANEVGLVKQKSPLGEVKFKSMDMCKNCFKEQILARQGKCPYCNEPILVGTDDFVQNIIDEKWYHEKCFEKQVYLDKIGSTQSTVVHKETVKEVVVKVRCPYCHALYDEKNDRCPHCGGIR
ncbi:MAG: hypothetical protein QXD70_01030 [Candidatus Bathyarchaeia archaeon]